MAEPPPGRFAYYQEELDELLRVARQFVTGLKREGHIQIDRVWLLDEHPTVAGEGAARFDVLDVIAAANYLGLVELDVEEDGWIRLL